MPENPIDRWLDTAVSRLHGPRTRKKVRRELEDHIRDRITLLTTVRGLPEDAATREAVARMGDAEELSEQLALVRHPIKRLFL